MASKSTYPSAFPASSDAASGLQIAMAGILVGLPGIATNLLVLTVQHLSPIGVGSLTRRVSRPLTSTIESSEKLAQSWRREPRQESSQRCQDF